ncbi:MAG: cation-translocating P-type ATPase [Verrucomicrobia bacterium]|nr:MAG: cation-translocating P-type ATPase [Verrucomicrobiota bacterium]
MEKIWQLEPAATAAQLRTDLAQGLTATEAARCLTETGPNQLQEQAGHSPWKIFFDQFKDLIIWVLIGAALVSGFLKEWVDTGAIIGIVVLNAILGFIQEYRAEQALAALRRLASPNARVVRDGQLLSIPSAALVPGDLIELEAGDYVAADARVVSHTANFAVQEASLTGESAPVAKHTPALAAADLPLAERANIVFMGTAVVTGKARALVAETGMRTELGRIAGMIQAIETEPTPLQKKLDTFGVLLVKLCAVLVALVFVLQWWRAGWHLHDLGEIFLTAVSLAVAAIPEGLPAVVTIALALGVQRMVKRHALIRKLPSVETLGCATVICSDKTGTLTRNEMTVQAIYTEGQLTEVTGVGYAPQGTFRKNGAGFQPLESPALRAALECGVLCNAANLRQEDRVWKIVGDPTEAALLTVAGKAGLDRITLEREQPLSEELPFDSERKRMTMIRRATDGRRIAYVKGAPDVILAHSTLPEAQRDALRKINAELAGRALRVLAVARRELGAELVEPTIENVERELTFLGLVAMMDPPREEARIAMATCRAAGIRAVMITGDDPNTATAIGRELGMLGPDDHALTGAALDKLDDTALAAEVEHAPVFARVAPEHKLRIVRAWKQRGQIVAMTGDGVNDAPAVKEADIGVAMGITGTDVTKEVSDMIVTDDNFASIVAAVEEGRGIYDNILKFVHYLLSCNIGEILVMLIASLLGLPAPLLPIHILWVNLVTDGLPALALGIDPVDADIMRRPPRDPAEPVVDRRRGWVMLLQGAFIAFCALSAFALVNYVEQEGLRRAQTAAFAVLSGSQLFHAFNCRHQTKSLFTLGVFSNPQLLLATGFSLVLQTLVITVPCLDAIFKTEPLSAFDWLLVLGLSSLPLWLMELVKIFLRRRAAA